MNAPRKAPRPDSTDVYIGDDVSEFLNRSLVPIKRNLLSGFNYRTDHNINWTPKELPQYVKPEPKGHGSNNTHYVVPRFNAIFGGRSAFKGNPTWQNVEEEAKRIWNLEQTDASKTRNIDYWRSIEIGNATFYQACEVKKTTGCYENQPAFIRSSRAQLEALASVKASVLSQIGPSIYIIGSCDYDRTYGWIITWWFQPIKDLYDFIIFDTSNFPYSRMYTKQLDGWIKPLS